MECPYCKAQNRDGVRYCSTCGNSLNSTSSTLPAGSGLSTSLSPGSRLQGGRYVIKQILGQGGMGAALLATDIRLDNKSVVIKELISDHVDQSRQLEDVRNFKREVSTLAHIDHPLVPNVTDHFQEGTRYFMVQEYVEGENLEERLEHTNQPMRERDALVCASEVLDVLDYLSLQTPPIVHRDIKPANIIIGTRDKRAHLVDFGIARADEVRNAQRKQTSALGTPGYAPPEQYQGNADPRSDLYALAATLHHVLTNRDPRNHPPFSYPPVCSLNPQLSPDIERVLVRALTNDINQRYQSASALKQDIDNILRQRFGISGNIDSYTLGTSGTSGAMYALGTSSSLHATNAPTSLNQPVAGGLQSASMTPVQPLPANFAAPTYPYQQGAAAVGKKHHPLLWLSLIVVAVLLVSATALFLGKFPGSTSGSKAGPTAGPTIVSGIGITRIGSENIGISDGSIAFDTTLEDGSVKAQAAQLLKQDPNNTSPVLSLLNQATDQNSNDAEALIYMEDLRVLNSNRPYVTIVVATMLSGDNSLIAVGRDDLQGAYVAQQEFNSGFKLHGGTQLRLLIANTGSKATYSIQVAQQIVQLAHADKTVVGVMGWPYSSYTQDAISTLGKAHIPLLSQTSSSDLLTGSSSYFFRVVPSNSIQAVSGAKYAETTLNAKRAALFYDDHNTYSQTLAKDFTQQFTADGNSVVKELYTVGKPETLPAALQDALKQKPDLIYFSGYSADLSTLLINMTSFDIPILGGDALYELGGYPPNARAGFTHLHFTAFAYPDEWDILNGGNNKPAFFTEYPEDFNPAGQSHPNHPYGFTRADNDAMLSYDATLTMLQGCDVALRSSQQNITPQSLQQGLLTLHGANAVQGVSGMIAFDKNGDPTDKIIVLLAVDSDGHIHMESASSGQFLKPGGQ